MRTKKTIKYVGKKRSSCGLNQTPHIGNTRSLILREEHRQRVSENRVLRIFRPKGDEIIGGENCIMRSFITSILLARYNEND
jgi:hypothetical protein